MPEWLGAQAANLCRLADPSVFWLRNASDLMIGAAYAMIPFGLASFLSARRDIEFGWLAWLFALFISLCGATHWMHIWLEFFPHQTAEAYLKAATALASITTAGAVVALLPDIKRLPTPAMMQREHEGRIEAERALRVALEERSSRDLRKHLETQDLLIMELNHRVKNTLTTVQAMATLSLKESGRDCHPSLEAFQARLFALSAAHNLLTETNWDGALLADLVTVELDFGADWQRVTIAGPEVHLSARQVVSLALVIHELATNEMKHGSLRDGATGRLIISWDVVRDRLCFNWESHVEGEAVIPPERLGFGTKMIRRAVERELSGELTTEWEPGGMRLRFTIPLETSSPGAPAAAA